MSASKTFNLLGRSALITGGASGIGKAMSHRLLQGGVKTILAVDVNEALLHPAAEELQKAHPSATILPILCDVTNSDSLRSAFETPNLSAPLTIIVNNAGTALEHKNWKFNIDLNLTAAIEGTTLALETFGKNQTPGVIVNVASMAGIYPMPYGPVYSAAKHGLVGYSRCFDYLHRKGIRVGCLCPAFVDTPLVQGMLQSSDPKLAAAGKIAVDSLGGLIPMDHITDAFMQLIEDESIVGGVMRITNAGGAQLNRFPGIDKMDA